MGLSLRSGFTDGLIPFLVLIASMVVCYGLNQAILRIDDKEIQDQKNVLGKESDPTRGRFIFCIISFLGAIVAAYFASKIDSEKLLLIPWTCATVGGTLLWQSLGENIWHFGLKYMNTGIFNKKYEVFGNFPRIETFQGVPFIILFIIVFFTQKSKLGFGLSSFLATFLGNWYIHMCMVASYPIATMMGSTLDMDEWYRVISGFNFAIFLVVGVLLILLDGVSKENKYYSSILLYIAFGEMLFGLALLENKKGN